MSKEASRAPEDTHLRYLSVGLGAPWFPGTCLWLGGTPPLTYDFSNCLFPKFNVMHFQNGDTKLYTVVLLFLCFLKILTKLCCRWSWSRRSTVNNCRVREFQIPDRRAQ